MLFAECAQETVRMLSHVDGDDTYPSSARDDIQVLTGADMVVGDRLSSKVYGEKEQPQYGKLSCQGSINFCFQVKSRIS